MPANRFPAVGAKGAVRIAAEVPLMLPAFVLGVPMFAVIIGGYPMRIQDRGSGL